MPRAAALLLPSSCSPRAATRRATAPAAAPTRPARRRPGRRPPTRSPSAARAPALLAPRHQLPGRRGPGRLPRVRRRRQRRRPASRPLRRLGDRPGPERHRRLQAPAPEGRPSRRRLGPRPPGQCIAAATGSARSRPPGSMVDPAPFAVAFAVRRIATRPRSRASGPVAGSVRRPGRYLSPRTQKYSGHPWPGRYRAGRRGPSGQPSSWPIRTSTSSDERHQARDRVWPVGQQVGGLVAPRGAWRAPFPSARRTDQYVASPLYGHHVRFSLGSSTARTSSRGR